MKIRILIRAFFLISFFNNIRNTFNLTNSFNSNFYHLDDAKQS